MKEIDTVIKKIEDTQYKLSEAETNLQYISRLKALKYWLHQFDSLLTLAMRLEGQYSAQYISYFYTGSGFSLWDRVCNSIIEYDYGYRPF